MKLKNIPKNWQIIGASFLAAQFMPATVRAAGSYSSNYRPPRINDVEELLDKVIEPIAQVMFDIFLIVSVIMILTAAYFYVTAAGNPEKVKKATSMLTYAVVAIVVAVLAFGIPRIIGSIFGARVDFG